MSQEYRQHDLRAKGRYDILCTGETEENRLVISKTSEEAITLIQGENDDGCADLGRRTKVVRHGQSEDRANRIY